MKAGAAFFMLSLFAVVYYITRIKIILIYGFALLPP